MKRLALLTALFLATALTSCKAKTDLQDWTIVQITKTVEVNGVKSTSALNFTRFAMRAALGNNPNTAAYVTIRNTGQTADRLVSAACACATTATLHTMTMTNGVMDMQEKADGFVIAPGETVTFAPGGNHIMLEGLTTRPQDGATQDIMLQFEKAGPVTLHLPVSNTPLAKTEAETGGHDGMKM